MNTRKFTCSFSHCSFAVIVIGVIGYSRLLGLGLVDAFYMTVITISTVGYGEVGVMTVPAKIFSICIIFSGLAVVGYGLTSVFSLFFEGGLKDAWRKRRMDTKIGRLKDHFIVCGAGDTAAPVIERFCESGTDFVVIEKNEERVEELLKDGIPTVHGDASHEAVLEEAGIKKAKGIVCVLTGDADNVFTVLTARQMNEKIYIVSKAVEKSAHNKLMKAGADKTISPNEIVGQRIAALMLRPSVISFLDVITRAGDVTLDLEEVTIPPRSGLAGKKLSEARIPEKTGLIVLAVKSRDDSSLVFNPSSGAVLDDGDTMIVMGTKEQVEKLRVMVGA